METKIHRKQCMEVSGGRRTYEANYEMPGLAMQLYSRQCGTCLHGGGEVHYVSSCASGRITRVMLADIAGAEDVFKRLSCEIRDGLLRNVNSLFQDRVVTNVSHQFREFARQGGYATASVATYFAPTKSFVMCNIGNPPAVIFRARERNWEVLHGEPDPDVRSDDEIQGVLGENEYRHIRTKLEVDDVVVLYGNGFAESAFPGGSMVGHHRLIESLQDSPHSHPDSRLQHLVGLVQQNSPIDQDSTILVCRVTKSRVRLQDNLLAPLRIFQRPRDATKFC